MCVVIMLCLVRFEGLVLNQVGMNALCVRSLCYLLPIF